MKTIHIGMRQKVLSAHRDAIALTHAPAVTAETVRRFMPGLKRQSQITRILNSLAGNGALSKGGYQERGRFVTTYGIPAKAGVRA